MLKPNLHMIILPALLLAPAAPNVRAETMSSEKVCRYDTMIACSEILDADGDHCQVQRPAFAIVAVGMGASQYAFEFDDDTRSTNEYFRGRNEGFGPAFQRGDEGYTLGSTGDNPVALIVRTKNGKPVTAETWGGKCSVRSVDIDMIEQNANEAR